MPRRGDVQPKPETGALALRPATDQTTGSRVLADLYIGPRGRLVAEHFHPGIRERFTVIRGRVGFSIGGKRSIAEPGVSIVVPPGLGHDWWNAGDEEAHLLVEIAPASRFEAGVRPPLFFSILAPIARLFGVRGSYPEYLMRSAGAKSRGAA